MYGLFSSKSTASLVMCSILYIFLYIHIYTHTHTPPSAVRGDSWSVWGFRTESGNILRLSPKIRFITESAVTHTSCLYRLFAPLKDSRPCLRGGGTPPGPHGAVGISITRRGWAPILLKTLQKLLEWLFATLEIGGPLEIWA